jgi:hypothetical protein
MAKKAGLLVPFSLTLGEDGVHSQSARGEALLKWSAVAFCQAEQELHFHRIYAVHISRCSSAHVPVPTGI